MVTVPSWKRPREAALAIRMAGQAVMARSLDLEVRSLTIDRDAGSDPGVILEAEGTVSASDLLAVWVAGPASVAVIFPDEAPDAGATDGDRRRALQQALRIEHRDAEAHEQVAAADAQVRGLLAHRPDRIAQITAVALALVEERTLTGTRLDAVIARALSDLHV